MTIGYKISQQRLLLNLSQQQLGELVGVGKKTISNWEKGITEPNASNIVALARHLHISTDKLLCFNDRRDQLEKDWQNAFREYGDDSKITLPISISALEEYPNDRTFLFRAAIDEERLGDMETDNKIKWQRFHRAMNYAQRLIAVDKNSETAKHLIVRLYSKLGHENMAIEYAYKCENVDLALKFCLKGDPLRRHRQHIIGKKLTELIYEIPKKDHYSADLCENIVNTVIPDGNYQFYFHLIDGIYISRAQIYLESGEQDAAIDTLRKLFEIAKSTNEITKKSRRLTAPLFDLLEDDSYFVEHIGYIRSFLTTLEHCFTNLKDNKEFQALLDEVKALNDKESR